MVGFSGNRFTGVITKNKFPGLVKERIIIQIFRRLFENSCPPCSKRAETYGIILKFKNA